MTVAAPILCECSVSAVWTLRECSVILVHVSQLSTNRLRSRTLASIFVCLKLSSLIYKAWLPGHVFMLGNDDKCHMSSEI